MGTCLHRLNFVPLGLLQDYGYSGYTFDLAWEAVCEITTAATIIRGSTLRISESWKFQIFHTFFHANSWNSWRPAPFPVEGAHVVVATPKRLHDLASKYQAGFVQHRCKIVRPWDLNFMTLNET